MLPEQRWVSSRVELGLQFTNKKLPPPRGGFPGSAPSPQYGFARFKILVHVPEPTLCANLSVWIDRWRAVDPLIGLTIEFLLLKICTAVSGSAIQEECRKEFSRYWLLRG